MIIYTCRWTGDEMCSDAFKPRKVIDREGNEVPGLIEIDSQKGGGNIDIGCGNAFGGEEEADGDDGVEMVNNVIDETLGFCLLEVPMSKKDFKDYLATYCKTLRQKLKDDSNVSGPEVKAFTNNAPIFCKWLLGMYSDLQFYITRAMDPEASMVFTYYPEGALNPTFVYIEAGMKTEKC